MTLEDEGGASFVELILILIRLVSSQCPLLDQQFGDSKMIPQGHLL